MPVTSPSRRAICSRSPASRARLPSRTQFCSTATAAGVPRSSFIAAVKSSGMDTGVAPTTSVARVTKLSIRARAVADSAIESSAYSMMER